MVPSLLNWGKWHLEANLILLLAGVAVVAPLAASLRFLVSLLKIPKTA